MSKSIKALLLGDVFGKPGCRAVLLNLKNLIKKHRADFVILNGENAADGFGITPEIAQDFFSGGVDVITTGNHIWQKPEIFSMLDKRAELLRPSNYPSGAPGHGFCIVEKRGLSFGVINLQGRVRLKENDCPFRVGSENVKTLRKKTPLIFVDFHAEDVEEKEALALHLDGKVSALVGTHTHIQTADERILPKGTAYISDIGMIGPAHSVIGGDEELSVSRALTQMPIRMEVSDNRAHICGVVIEVDCETGKARSIKSFQEESLL